MPPAASLWFSCVTWIARWYSGVSRTAAVSDPRQASRSAQDSLQRGSSSDDFLLCHIVPLWCLHDHDHLLMCEDVLSTVVK